MTSSPRTFLYCRNKAQSIIIGFALLTHASVCFTENDAHGDASGAVGNINQANQNTLLALGTIDIKSSNHLIYANLNNAPMRHVLKKLSAQSGIKIWVSDSVKPKQITAHFKMLPMDKALRRLLGDSSYILVNNDKDDATAVTSIYILPLGEESLRNMKLMLGKRSVTGADLLTNALKSKSIPNDIKAAMSDQVRMNTSKLQQTVSAQRNQAIHKLIEQLEKVGKADPKTLHQLHKKYELLKSQK